MIARTVPLLALLLLGCGRPRPEPIVLRDSPWYPLGVGARWDYKSGALTMTRRVLCYDRIGDTPCAFIETRRGREVILREHVATAADGVYLMAVDGRRVTPPLCILKLPPRAGQHWTSSFREGTAARKGVYLLEEGEVTVPAGKYRAVVLRGEILEHGLPRQRLSYWFASGVGVVKQVVRRDGQKAVYELERYRPPEEGAR